MKNLNLSDICIYTRTYAGDREFLPFLYESIDLYCGDWGEVVLVVESGDYEAIKDYVPSWVKIDTEESFAPGAIQQKFSKITADLHTEKPYIFHIDSDSVFTSAVSPSDLAVEGRPYLEYSSYAHLLKYQNSAQGVSQLKEYCVQNVLPGELERELTKIGVSDHGGWMRDHFESWLETNFEGWFNDFFERWKKAFGVDVWREGTRSAIGCEVDHEFSRRPEKLYPRGLYPAARAHIENLHCVSFKDFIKSRVGRQQGGLMKSAYFSDLNYLGAYLYNFMSSSMEWIDIEKRGYGARPPFVKQFISFDLLSNGKLKPGAADSVRSAIYKGSR